MRDPNDPFNKLDKAAMVTGLGCGYTFFILLWLSVAIVAVILVLLAIGSC
jgi:hypothetical protein